MSFVDLLRQVQPHFRDDQEVSYQSGFSRAGNSLKGLCVSPFLLLGAAFLVGWNEKNAVCQSSAIWQGYKVFNDVGCKPGKPSHAGELVYFSCDLDKDGLQDLAPPGAFGDSLKFQGVGLGWTSQMLQCIETKSSRTEKDLIGGGTRTVTTYSYSLDWNRQSIDSHSFHNQPGTAINGQAHPCGNFHNPIWPGEVPVSGQNYAPRATAGGHVIPSSFLMNVPLDDPVDSAKTPQGWQRTSKGSYQSELWVQGTAGVGRVRVQFFGNNWGTPTVSVLGKESGGVIGTWRADRSWGCHGSTIGTLLPGRFDSDDFFDALASQAKVLTIILRIVGFLILWLGFCMCFGPLEVFADFIPCIGPLLGDSIAAVTSCLSCIPACLCFTIIAGFMWIFMRPIVGCTLLGIAFAISVMVYMLDVQYASQNRKSPADREYGATQDSKVSAGSAVAG
eukprot:TRINITY_DN5448_c0_g1_i1.p1 TRINITY_DN5448_c0_g1~~TRINITY_DN5448_c0_g1_i1.p1  ORF type:complete len:447 (+),score=53.67 TRINITY_DN5448_c0_g1_i1:76-1416(+)